MEPGRVIRQCRLARGLTQAQLALRAGSTQAAISRLERDQISPTFETFERLLAVMGARAEVIVGRDQATHDPARLASVRARSPAERLTLAIGWNRLAGEFARAGEDARARINDSA